MLVNATELTHWISLHGPVTLFFLLALGIIGLPIPDETLLIISGTLIAKGIISLPSTFIFALFGTMTGITISFLIGRLVNQALIHTVMEKLKVNLKHWYRMEKWYQKYGKWTLTAAYFIPGIRHISGIFAGLMELSYKQFAIYAYLGALLWSILFLSLGYFVGEPALNFISNLAIL